MPRHLLRATTAILMAARGYAQLPAPKIDIEHYTLRNGMQVILCRNARIPQAHLNLRFYVGSRNERPGRTGLAHLFEHLMFDIVMAAGPDAKAAEFEEVAQGMGATAVAAFTHVDYTEYLETVPSSRLERMLWLESNRLVKLPLSLTQKRFETEREVVRNELRQKIENQPYHRINLPLYEYGFPAGHPYAHHPVGSHEDLLSSTLDDVRAFARDFYNPDNASLVLAGDFDPVQAKLWIAKYFGTIPPGPRGAISPVHSTPQLQVPAEVEVRDQVPYERVILAWPTAGIYQPDDAALEIAAQVMIDDASNWNRALREPASTGIGTEQQRMQDASLFLISADPADKSTVADVQKTVAAGIARFAREGPSAEELERAVKNLEFGEIGKLEDLSDLAVMLNEVQQFYGGVEHFQDWLSRFRRASADSVHAAVGRWLNTPNHLTIHVIRQTELADSSVAPDRTKAPPFGSEKPFVAPEVKSAKLANGLQIFVVERHDVPKVAVQLRFKLGNERNQPGKAGLMALVIATAGRGTTDRTEDEIKQECSRLAVSISADDNAVSQGTGIQALRGSLDAGLALLADVVRHPSFPQDRLDAQKSEFVGQFEKAEGRIDNFWPAAMSIAFGKAHPFGNGIGTAESYRSITREDLVGFARRCWKPDIAALIFAGDITLAEAVARAQKNFGDWEGSAGVPPPVPAPAPMTGQLFLIDRPGATQTMVVQVLPGIPRDHPDFPALLLVDRVWGSGGPLARLNQILQREKGIAYYATSELAPFRGGGLWVAHTPVEAGHTRDAMVTFMKELRGIAGEKPISAQELGAAKRNFLRSWPGDFETIWGTAASISHVWEWGLPMSELQSFPERVARVNLERANAAARRYALPDRAFFVLIGDRRKIEPQIAGLRPGAVIVLP